MEQAINETIVKYQQVFPFRMAEFRKVIVAPIKEIIKIVSENHINITMLEGTAAVLCFTVGLSLAILAKQEFCPRDGSSSDAQRRASEDQMETV